MEFHYGVRNLRGQLQRGVMEAENSEQVAQILTEQGYYIVELGEMPAGSRVLDFKRPFERVSSRDLTVMTRQLATMLTAGLSILHSLYILRSQTRNAKFARVLSKVSDDIEAGSSFWEALARYPDVFSSVYVSMVRAGEMGGFLDKVLYKLAEHLKRENEIQRKVHAAAIYPAIISVFAILVVLFILSFVMPTFVDMFNSAGVELPVLTRILLGVSMYLSNNWLWVLILIVLSYLFLKQVGKIPSGRYFYDKLYLCLPVVGRTISQIIVARFARTMGALLSSGITVLHALEVVEDVVGNAVISKAIALARASISEGDSITEPLQNTGVFEPMVTQMILVGEETGALDDMFIHLSDYYESEVMHSVEAMMAFLEPVLVLLVALVVGGIVLATLLPVFELMHAVGI